MKRLLIVFSILVVVATSQAQTFSAERSKDIKKFTEQMNKFEPAYLKHDTRTIKRGVKKLLKIMDREIGRTTEDLARMKHEMYGNKADVNAKVNVVVMSDRLTVMKYIRQRVVDFDLSTLYEYSTRELAGFRGGLNHFKTLMEYNYNPSLAIHHISPNAKRVYTPVKE